MKSRQGTELGRSIKPIFIKFAKQDIGQGRYRSSKIAILLIYRKLIQADLDKGDVREKSWT